MLVILSQVDGSWWLLTTVNNLDYLQIDRKKFLIEPRHLGATLGASKTISEPILCLAQTAHQSCTDTNTISKQTEMRFHNTLPRSSIRCIQNNFWANITFGANHAPILHRHKHCLQHRPKRDSTWHTLPRSSNRCTQNNFWAYGMFGTNRAPILHRH
jgi:hypothetical protein